MIDPASIILACAAIALSVAFFWMSYKMSERVSEATRRIELSVEKLETVFSLQHKETFSMVKTAWDDLIKHAWPEEELIEKKADERIENIRKEMSEKMKAEISEISKRSKRTDAQIKELQISMEKLLNEAITESRHVEKETALKTLMNRILVELFEFFIEGDEKVALGKVWTAAGKPFLNLMCEACRQLEGAQLIEEVKRGTTIELHLTSKGMEKAKEIESRMYSEGLDLRSYLVR